MRRQLSRFAALVVLLCAHRVLAQSDAGTASSVRVIETNTAAPGVLSVTLETQSVETGLNTVPATLDLDPTHWRINGTAPASIARYSIPWDEGNASRAFSPNTFPITARHQIMLRLAQPFQEGTTYTVTTPYGSTGLTFRNRGTRCLAIKTNQAAYSGVATSRFANFGVFLGTGGTMALSPLPAYDVVREADGVVVYSGTSVDMGDDTGLTGPKSGEHVYRLPLNAVGVGGPYFVSVRGCGKSRSFGIGGDAARNVAYVATRGLYHQRCGIALERPYTEFTRAVCHTRVADTRTPFPSSTGFISVPAGMATFPIRGGYHDAADFNRQPLHTMIPLLMLGYYEGWTWHFTDRQYNIPESGNGIPDFLDEALWGLLLWENLQITTAGDPLQGGVRGGTEMNKDPDYGVQSAASDTAAYGTWGVTEDVTAISAGMFAQASRLVRPYDVAHSDALLNRARMAWAYLQRTTNVNQPATRFMYAALQLYLTTGEQSFHDIFKADAQAIVVDSVAYPEQYLPGNTDTCQTVHFSSYLLPTARPTDAALVASMKAKVIAGADSGGYMNADVEHSPYPQVVNKFYSWGATTAQGRYADVYAWATLFQTDPGIRQTYINAVSQMADFALGLNPLGISFYTGLGTDQPNSPAHLDSYFTKYGLSDGVTTDHLGHPIGNVPGILLFGPTDGRSEMSYQMAVSQQLVPAWDSLPLLRRFGDGWTLLNSTEFTTFQTIAWNVAMLGFLFDASPAPIPPPADAGVPDASVPVLDAGTRDAGTPSMDAGTEMVCVQPPPVCGPRVSTPVTLRRAR